MEYIFFDTAVNGYHSLHLLRNAFPVNAPLMPVSEEISEYVAPFIFQKKEVEASMLSHLGKFEFKELLIADADLTLEEIKNHYEQFVVQTIKGRDYYFRFWNRKVFIKYITGCNSVQLKIFFGKVDRWVCLDEEGKNYLQFTFDGHQLNMKLLEEWNLFLSNSSLGKTASAPLEKDEQKEEISEKKEPPSGQKPRRRFFY